MRVPVLASILVCSFFTLLGAPAFSQEKGGPAAKAPAPLSAERLGALEWRCIGPANMGGRITAVAIDPADPARWWAATASGGLVRTLNDGITFEHQFDRESTVSVGDMAVAPSDANIVWVGTGEANPRNSVSFGNGVYKSVDGGKTWKQMGLGRSFQVGAIAVHPESPDVVYVGALGRLWGPNEERGLYKTTDGGKSWEKILHVDDKTGVVDVQLMPGSPDTLLVATYERMRDGFDTNDPAKRWGPGSGLYKSTDGGKSFRKITEGLPTCQLGRIGISYGLSRPEVVFAVVETEKIGTEPLDAPYMGITGTDAEAGAKLTQVVEKGPAAAAGLKTGDIVLRMGEEPILSYADLVRCARFHVAGEKVEFQVSRDRKSMVFHLEFGKRPKQGGGQSFFSGSLGGQRPNVQDQQGKEGHEYGGLYRSEDGGETWTRANSLNPRPMYFSEVRVDPNDADRVYVLGIRLWLSEDGGKTLNPAPASGVHVDHHALWIDPADSRHMILGNDGGIYVTRDRGASWDHLNHVAIGQFYHVGVDTNRAYRVYGGLQDNGSWGGPAMVRHGSGPSNADWYRVGGGDGFRCQVDPEDPDLVYFEMQYGGTARLHLTSGEGTGLQPRAPKGTRYRFNWNTPFVLSHHNSRIYHVAGNRVFKSLDRGRGLRAVSPEITATDRGSATALAESPHDPGVLYVGTDDGALWQTKDGGHTWTDLFAPAPEPEKANPEEPAKDAAPPSKDAPAKPEAPKKPAGPSLAELMPERRWVNWIEVSRFKPGRVYVVFDGHRSDDDRPHVLVTEDHGASWRSITASLPPGSGTTRVLREDLTKENLLYLGTELGAWFSIDRGATWVSLNTNLPTVAVHAFALHPTANEIVAATHGRSLWVLDVTLLRQLTPEVLSAPAHLFAPNTAVMWQRKPSRGASRAFVGRNPPLGAVVFYSLNGKERPVSMRIESLEGKKIRDLEVAAATGLHRATWDLRHERRGRARYGPRVRPGTYRVVLEVDGGTLTQSLTVQIDPENPDERWIAWEEEQDERERARADGKNRKRWPWLFRTDED